MFQIKWEPTQCSGGLGSMEQQHDDGDRDDDPEGNSDRSDQLVAHFENCAPPGWLELHGPASGTISRLMTDALASANNSLARNNKTYEEPSRKSSPSEGHPNWPAILPRQHDRLHWEHIPKQRIRDKNRQADSLSHPITLTRSPTHSETVI